MRRQLGIAIMIENYWGDIFFYYFISFANKRKSIFGRHQSFPLYGLLGSKHKYTNTLTSTCNRKKPEKQKEVMKFRKFFNIIILKRITD